MSDPLRVKINSDGTDRGTTVTVNDVPIPCTKITWTATIGEPFARCELEVPIVAINAEAQEIVARLVPPVAGHE